MKEKVIMLTTTAYMSERFNRENIRILNDMGYIVNVVANWEKGNPISEEILTEFKEWIIETGNEWTSIPIVRNPLAKSNYTAYKKCVDLIKKDDYKFIHCHTPVGGVVGRMVAHKTKTKVIYTAHGFHFYKGAPLINWLVYYPVEKFLSRWTDVLITINKEDYNRAKKFKCNKLEMLHGIGIDTKKFRKDDRIRLTKREELNLKEKDVMLLSVGELSKRKNHQVVIRALKEMRDKRDISNIKYYIAGQGKLHKELNTLIKELGLEENVFLLGYRTDVGELLQATDLFILPSTQEGVSVAVMEAVGCMIPVIGSRIRGNTDLILNANCLFDYMKVDDVVRAIEYVIDIDSEVIKKVVEDNRKVLDDYDIDIINLKMKKIYSEAL